MRNPLTSLAWRCISCNLGQTLHPFFILLLDGTAAILPASPFWIVLLSLESIRRESISKWSFWNVILPSGGSRLGSSFWCKLLLTLLAHTTFCKYCSQASQGQFYIQMASSAPRTPIWTRRASSFLMWCGGEAFSITPKGRNFFLPTRNPQEFPTLAKCLKNTQKVANIFAWCEVSCFLRLFSVIFKQVEIIATVLISTVAIVEMSLFFEILLSVDQPQTTNPKRQKYGCI